MMTQEERKKLYERLNELGIDTSIGHHNEYKVVNYEVSRTTITNGKSISSQKRH